MTLKGTIQYVGNKRRELPKIYEVINTKKDFTTFVDLFGGSGTVGLNVGAEYKKPVIINDINPVLIEAYNDYMDLDSYRKSNLALFDIPRNKETFEEYNANIDSLEKMRYIKVCSFSSLGTSYNQKRADCLTLEAINRKIKEREKIEPRLKSFDVVFSNKDFREILDEYHDNEGAIIYMDPPYLNRPDKNYKCTFSLDDLEYIKNYMKTCKCLAILNVDFSGHIYVNFKELNLLSVYNLEYSMSSHSKAKGKIYKNYHCLITNQI